MDFDIIFGDTVIERKLTLRDIDPIEEMYRKLNPVDPKKVIVVEDIVIEEAYRNKYPNLTDPELKKFLARYNGCYHALSSTAGFLNDEREREKSGGVKGIHSQPLVQVLSVSVESDDESLAVHGEIHAQFWYWGESYVRPLYSRKKTAPQFIGTSAVLALNVDDTSDLDYGCMPLSQNVFENRIAVNLRDSKGNQFARQNIELEDDIEDYGYDHQVVVRSKHIPSPQSGAGLTLRYAVIPFGVTCAIHVSIFPRDFSVGDFSVDVSGSIVAKYAGLEECLQLYDKPEKEAQREHCRKPLQLSRSWLALPAYSPSLVVDVELSILGPQDKKPKVVKGAVELLPHLYQDTIVADDYLVILEHAWSSPDRHWPSNPTEIQPEDEDGSPTPYPPYPPYPSPALEIFSVFLGRERPMAAHVHGSIQISPYPSFIASALTLEEDAEFIPVSDGTRLPYEPFEMKVDIKDVEGSVAVKGYVNWWEYTKSRFLCCFFRGRHGFLAFHYALFPEAIEAHIQVVLKSKTRVSGSLVAQYSCFEYPSKYDRDFYRTVLFRCRENHSVQLPADCTMPLSRSKVVVPSNSSLILKVDLSFGGEKLSEDIEIRPNAKDTESSDGTLDIRVDWRKIE